MKLCIICPAPPGSRSGNRTTAVRWARILRSLGHRVTIASEYTGAPCDVLIALHARRSFEAVRRFSAQHPGRPLIVTLTGTDLYGDLRHSRRAQQALDLATRLILLQPLGLRELPRPLRSKARVIYQSAPAPRRGRPASATYDVCVIANLRPVKDPLRAALASRRLPPESRIRVLHVGKALSAGLARCARAETRRNPRYRWLGEQPPARVRRLLTRSRLMVLSSRTEGGANVVSEAIAAGVPIVASRIPGTVGLVGSHYAGLFPVGDTGALARLLRRAESDHKFYRQLSRACAEHAERFKPAHERRAWELLLREIISPESLPRCPGVPDRRGSRYLRR